MLDFVDKRHRPFVLDAEAIVGFLLLYEDLHRPLTLILKSGKVFELIPDHQRNIKSLKKWRYYKSDNNEVISDAE